MCYSCCYGHFLSIVASTWHLCSRKCTFCTAYYFITIWLCFFTSFLYYYYFTPTSTDGSTLIPWPEASQWRGMSLSQTLMQNHTSARHWHRGRCSGEPGSSQQNAIYDELAFYPVAIETWDTWNHWAVELVREISRRATLIIGEPRESTFLFQHLSIAPPPKEEMWSPSLTLLTSIRRCCSHTLLSTLSLRLCASGRKK